eukprot:CAMPEP_0201514688 /NCGR_PEP_ID=MMETSP0161_2-20130828/6464_1 /ASSEMBLY_ACC=CAM_ASM_000251 /TAXON_ID=180227 /ORGANISM="Neoparamoeba aestuarina, Strain SoJaBio B1-5/56/2" /LENGTH=308 /DNA_ID=CAMNT_0047911315 /DNA_START=31 /DNA_END=954 /DNA_ORIENTATION=-
MTYFPSSSLFPKAWETPSVKLEGKEIKRTSEKKERNTTEKEKNTVYLPMIAFSTLEGLYYTICLDETCSRRSEIIKIRENEAKYPAISFLKDNRGNGFPAFTYNNVVVGTKETRDLQLSVCVGGQSIDQCTNGGVVINHVIDVAVNTSYNAMVACGDQQVCMIYCDEIAGNLKYATCAVSVTYDDGNDGDDDDNNNFEIPKTTPHLRIDASPAKISKSADLPDVSFSCTHQVIDFIGEAPYGVFPEIDVYYNLNSPYPIFSYFNTTGNRKGTLKFGQCDDIKCENPLLQDLSDGKAGYGRDSSIAVKW